MSPDRGAERGVFVNRTLNLRSIRAIGYDEASRTLEIEFMSGSIYQYFDVPQGVHRELMAAGSHGSYLATHIKGHYRYARV